MIILESTKTKNLSKDQVNQICKLKDSHWRYGLKSQLDYFKKNIKSNDFHNCLYLNNKLIGYTVLRNRTYLKSNKKQKYFYFDTLIILKKLRKQKLSSLLMIFNNKVINNHKKPSFLICDSKQINFYKKFSWVKIEKRYFKIMDHSFKSNCMFYNFKNLKLSSIKKDIKIYINE